MMEAVVVKTLINYGFMRIHIMKVRVETDWEIRVLWKFDDELLCF